ncbi:MAG: adenosylcobinamide-phosphate synthase CbiB [Paracoccaceae bacterium]|nr:adenosylcobinamide-phosphate synthase CbiB [Paracoccaceae bacterium]
MTGFHILLIALLADAVVGDPRWLWRHIPHPVALTGRLIEWLETRLNAGDHRRLKGALVVAGLVAAAVLAGVGVQELPDLGIVEIVLVMILLAQGNLASEVGAVAVSLRDSLEAGRARVSRIVGRDPEALDSAGVARAAIESAAENFSDGVVAPAFWYVVAGLPGLVVYKAVNTADSMIGYRNERYSDFGWAAARLDDILNWLPARLTAALIAVTHGSRRAFACMLRDGPLHRSPNAGWPEAAMAAVLGVSLAGPRRYGGRIEDFPYVFDEGRKGAGPAEIEGAVRALWRTWAVLVAVVAAVAFLT